MSKKRKCLMCETEYEYCPYCWEYERQPRWRTLFDRAECQDVYYIISDWLGKGIRQYKPYLKTNDHWFWRVENVEYKGLHIIGIYLSVCNQSGTDRCGWGNASIGLIFEEGSDRVRKLNYAKSNKVINFNFLEKERGAVDSTAYEGI